MNKFQSSIQLLMAIVVLTLVGCNNDRVLPPPTEAEFSTGAFSVPFPSDVFMTYAALNEFSLISNPDLFPDAAFTNTPIIPSAEDASDTGDVLVAQGFLDGFSVTSPMQLDFTHNLDPTSVVGGQSVRVFEIAISPPSLSVANTAIQAPIAMPASIIRELQADSDYTVTMARSVGYQMVVRPRVPWPASDNTSFNGTPLAGFSRGIMVVVTNDVRDFRGNPVIRSDQYDRMANGIPSATGVASIDGFADSVGGMVLNSLQLLQNQGINPANVVVTNTFTCQSITDVVDAAVAQTLAEGPFVTTEGRGPTQGGVPVSGFDNVRDFLVNTGALSAADADALVGASVNPDLRQGTISLPSFYPGDETPAGQLQAVIGYLNTAGGEVVYQEAAPGASNPAFPTRYNTDIALQSQTFETPVLIATNPNVPGPWPVIIFQHGITRSRFDMAAIAPLFCGFGFAVVAMDAPLHGTTGQNPYAAQVGSDPSQFEFPGLERTFGIDVVNNETGEAGSDTVPDESGTHFLNFPSLISSRSVWTQAVCDLAALTEALPTWDVDGDTNPDFTDEVFYIGQSLGGLIGSTFLSAVGPDKIRGAELNVAGGHIAKLLENSPAYNPRLIAFFEGQGLVQGSTTAEQALNVISAIADGIDPICHIRRAAANTNLRLSFAVGGGTIPSTSLLYPPDLVVPIDSLGTGIYADFIGSPVSSIPTDATGDLRIYTGLVEPSYLGGGLPLARIGSVPKAIAPTVGATAGRIIFPNNGKPANLSIHYAGGDHGVFAVPGVGSATGYSMQFGAANQFITLRGAGDQPSTIVNNPGPLYADSEPPVESTNVSYAVEAGEVTVGEVTIIMTGDAANPVSATFDTGEDAGSLAAAAAAFDAHHFNWLQVVHDDALPPNAPSNDLGSLGGPVNSRRISPPSGGSGQSIIGFQDGVFADSKPLLWNEIQTTPDQFTADQVDGGPFYSVREFTDNEDAPAPAGVNAAVGDPSQQTELYYEIGPWIGDISSTGESIEIRVWLVAVDVNGNPVRYLRGFTYQQGENFTTGAVDAQKIAGIAEMPGSPGTTGDNDDQLLIGF